MILPDYELKEWAANSVMPFDPKNINPASLDLCLGNTIRTPRWYWKPVLWRLVWAVLPGDKRSHVLIDGDGNRYPNPIYWSKPKLFKQYLLGPGEFVLCSSMEITHIPDDVIAILFSKSSTGRRGIEHLHAGYGDPGFGDNERGGADWTWELVNVAPWPNLLMAGRPLMQLVLARLVGCPRKTYKEVGRYNEQSGPTGVR